MGDVRMTVPPLWLTGAGFAVGCLLAVVGVALLAGIAWALIVGGTALAGASLLLIPVDERESGQ
ncbi:hypothetical protein ACQP1V_36300 [Microtetraspora malaysiensis]|uniref:hypothetical protein n=1 Tax=Microtetraspora malaysiensis TaxID=161358 RepID=UPI003D9312F8